MANHVEPGMKFRSRSESKQNVGKEYVAFSRRTDGYWLCDRLCSPGKCYGHRFSDPLLYYPVPSPRVPKAGETWRFEITGIEVCLRHDQASLLADLISKGERWTYVSGPSDAPAEELCALMFDGKPICIAGPGGTPGTRSGHLKNPHCHPFFALSPAPAQPELPQLGETWRHGDTGATATIFSVSADGKYVDDFNKKQWSRWAMGKYWTRVSAAPAKPVCLLPDCDAHIGPADDFDGYCSSAHWSENHPAAQSVKTPATSTVDYAASINVVADASLSPDEFAIESGGKRTYFDANGKPKAAPAKDIPSPTGIDHRGARRVDTEAARGGEAAVTRQMRSVAPPLGHEEAPFNGHCRLGVACNVCVPPRRDTPWVSSLAWDWDLPDAT